MSVLFIIFSKARIWPKRSSSRYFGSFIEILTFHWAEIGGGRVPPVIMNLKNLFEFFRMHTANQKMGANSAKFASRYCPEIRNFYLLKLGPNAGLKK